MTHRNLSDLRSKNAEMEEQMIQLNKELHANQEIAKALEIDLKENVAQKNDQVNNTIPSILWMVPLKLIHFSKNSPSKNSYSYGSNQSFIHKFSVHLQEERIATLEKRYLNSQRESTTLRDLNEKLEQELKNKEDQSVLTQEKIKAISEKLDISEQKLIEFASMPDIEEQLRDRMEALTQVEELAHLNKSKVAVSGLTKCLCKTVDSILTFACRYICLHSA